LVKSRERYKSIEHQGKCKRAQQRALRNSCSRNSKSHNQSLNLF